MLEVLYIELTGKCNFQCVHCGNEPHCRSHLDTGLIERVMKEFDALGGKKLILTGGEPLLHPGLENILELASSHGYRTKLSTNGSLLSNPRYSFVLDHDIDYRLSLDGTPEVHNKIRGRPGAYDSLVAALRLLSARERQIVLRTTVMKVNQHVIGGMLSGLDRLTAEEDVSVYSVNIWPVRGIGKADRSLMLSAQEYEAFLRRLNAETSSLRPSFRIIVGPTFGLESEFSGGPLQSNDIYTCDILNRSLHIGSDGSVYPCSFVRHSLGNIADLSLGDILSSKQAVDFRSVFLDKENHDCGGCAYYPTCRAGCIAESYGALLGCGGCQGCSRVKDVYCFRR